METPPKPEETPIAQKRALRETNILLVADDDVYIRSLVKEALLPFGAVHEVTDGRAAVEAYKWLAPDIAFMDIQMPEKDGISALREILALDPQAFVVMLTSHTLQKNVREAIKIGARGFMAKPFSKTKILEYINRCPTLRPVKR